MPQDPRFALPHENVMGPLCARSVEPTALRPQTHLQPRGTPRPQGAPGVSGLRA